MEMPTDGMNPLLHHIHKWAQHSSKHILLEAAAAEQVFIIVVGAKPQFLRVVNERSEPQQ